MDIRRESAALPEFPIVNCWDKKDKFCPGMGRGYNLCHVLVMKTIVCSTLNREISKVVWKITGSISLHITGLSV